MPTPPHKISPPALPAPAPDQSTLPTSLTFFLPVQDRQRILKKLKRFNSDRRLALLRALKLDSNSGATRHG